MVRVPIAPIRPKGNHHIRAEAADDFSYLSSQHLCINAAERAIHIIQAQSMLNAQALTGQVQFLLTYCRERAACRDTWTTYLTGLPVRRRHHHHLCTTGAIPGKGTSRAKGFVVGVGKNAQDAGPLLYEEVIHIWLPFLTFSFFSAFPPIV